LERIEGAVLFKPFLGFLASLLRKKLYFSCDRLPVASMLNRDTPLCGTTGDIHLDEPIESPAFLAISRCVGCTRMALATRITAITLNGLCIVIAMITTELYRASGSAAGAKRIHP
jgi:hypothetical protein